MFTSKLIYVFVFAYAKCWPSHDAGQMFFLTVFDPHLLIVTNIRAGPRDIFAGGTESRSLEPHGKSREGGEYERGVEPAPLFRRPPPENLFKIYVSESAFQAMLKPFSPYSITSILSEVRHSNTLFFAINFSFPCHTYVALVRLCVLLWHSLGRLNNFLKFFD